MIDAKERDAFFAIGDPTRRKILGMLSQSEASITTIVEEFPITRTAVKKHLIILHEAKLVTTMKVGRKLMYQINPEPLKDVWNWVCYYKEFWEAKLDSLEEYLRRQTDEERN